jgi:ketosteroid isomerase-like protein
MKKVNFLKLFLFTITIIGFQSVNASIIVKPDTGEVKAAIHKVNLSYGEAFIKGDSSLFLNCYAPGAILMPANSPVINGTQGQLAFFKFAYKAGVRNIVVTTINLFGLTTEYVTEQGSYEMFGAGNVSFGKGKYLVLWKKTPAGWQMYRDMFSSDTPPARMSK